MNISINSNQPQNYFLKSQRVGNRSALSFFKKDINLSVKNLSVQSTGNKSE